MHPRGGNDLPLAAAFWFNTRRIAVEWTGSGPPDGSRRTRDLAKMGGWKMKWHGLLMGFAAVLLATAASAQPESAQRTLARFWQALTAGDAERMADFYAAEVTLVAGSELLKKEWGLNPAGDRSQDRKVKRADLVKGYQAMIAKAGVNKWRQALGKTPSAKVTTAVAQADDEGFKGVKKGDAILRAATGPGDDVLLFVFREDGAGIWFLVMEATDY
jgi:hypothetical protein